MQDLRSMCVAKPNNKFKTNRPSRKNTVRNTPSTRFSKVFIYLILVISVVALRSINISKYVELIGDYNVTLTDNTPQNRSINTYIDELRENIDLSFKKAKAIILKSTATYNKTNLKNLKYAADNKYSIAPPKLYTEPLELKTQPSIPAMGSVSSEFGYREHPITKDDDYHTGLDIAAPLGTEIYSALDGTVISVDEHSAYGKNVTIQHDDNITTSYAHCHKILVHEGQKVSKGEKIALVGSTGISTGAHLHFEVKIGDKYADPTKFLGITL